jgi:WD40 repeat protein
MDRKTHASAPSSVLVVRGDKLFVWSLGEATASVQALESDKPLVDIWPLPRRRLLVRRLDAAPAVYDERFMLQATLGDDEPFALAAHQSRDLILTYDGPNDSRLKRAHLPHRNNDRLSVWTASGRRSASHELRLGSVITLHPTEAILVSSPWRSNQLVAWDLKTEKVLLQSSLDSPISCLAFDPEGDRIAIGTLDKKVRVLGFPSGKPLAELARGGLATALCFGTGEIFSGSHDGKVRCAALGHDPTWAKLETGLVPHLDAITGLSISAGKLVSRDRGTVLSVFAEGAQQLVGLSGHDGNWAALCWQPAAAPREACFAAPSGFAEVRWGYHENHIGFTAALRVDDRARDVARLTYTKTYSPKGVPRDTVERTLMRAKAAFRS